ncbi:hypothetical protein LSUE1_G004788 [Lachnellula suecica]|uniref:Uncharacterized protein n=1 Tax=Lachnellula suecica TaxID=602035 RepID=A0A8T9C966_9HELO|nr:hypothetical protein LSUE1_G004788 [Lachnellula suecica]
MPAQPPTPQERANVAAGLQRVIDALTSNPQWNEANQNPTLFYVWDFTQNSLKRLADYENIQAGRPVQHPEQFRGGAGSGNAAALKVFQDVCSRTMMLDMLVNDTTGKAGMITGAGGALDFGQEARDAVAALSEACPDEHVMAGMMA